MNITEINLYPIKSFRGISLNEAVVRSQGLEHDRRWMLVTPEAKMITQRECPLLATLTPYIDSDGLRVVAGDGTEVAVPFNDASWTNDEVTVDVWGRGYVGVSATANINASLSELIDRPCQILSIRADVFRTKHDIAFHDDAPILIISESSLEELNRHLETPLPMNRFRPTIVVRDAVPFDEDEWQRIAVGDAVFHAVKACLRCVITTIDQAAGVPSGPEPLATLAKFRRKGEGVAFGQYYRPEQALATIKLGDPVTVLSAKRMQTAALSG